MGVVKNPKDGTSLACFLYLRHLGYEKPHQLKCYAAQVLERMKQKVVTEEESFF